MTEIAVRVVVAGRVQGVGYRAWAVDEAARRGLRGWVRNRRDGTVEALFIGAAEPVEAIIEACRHGPRPARVTNLERTPASDDGTPDFHGRETL